MATHGYIRTSRDQDLEYSGSSRDQWSLLDQQLGLGDFLVVAAVDRLGRRHLETIWRSTVATPRRPPPVPGRQPRRVGQVPGRRPQLAGGPHGQHSGQHGGRCGQPGAPEISRRTRAGLEAAKGKGKDLGRPRRLTEDQLTSIRQDLADEIPVTAVARKCGVSRPTLRSALNREDTEATISFE